MDNKELNQYFEDLKSQILSEKDDKRKAELWQKYIQEQRSLKEERYGDDIPESYKSDGVEIRVMRN